MSEDHERLEEARTLIEQRDFEAAREILQTMSANPTAHQWLTKVEAAIARQNAPQPSEDEIVRKLREARSLIASEDYTAARRLLSSIDHHPTAQEWIAKLDRRIAAQAGDQPDPAAGQSALLGAADDDAEWDDLEMHPAIRQTRDALQAAGINPQLVAVTLGLAAVSGFLAALIDPIFGIPGPFLMIALGWIVAALNGPTYAVIRGKIDIGGWAMSAINGFTVMFIWYIVTVIVTGDPDVTDGDFSARDMFASWVNNMNVLEAWWSGILVGLLSLGWYALLPYMPKLGERVFGYSTGIMDRLGERTEE